MQVAALPENTSFQARPWGGFEVLHEEIGYKVKRLYINPSERTSLQLHQHRAEYWMIEQGVAKITLRNDVFTCIKGASVSVAKNSKHQIENISSEMLVIFEVQLGEKLCEDDIIRFEDKYGRIG